MGAGVFVTWLQKLSLGPINAGPTGYSPMHLTIGRRIKYSFFAVIALFIIASAVAFLSLRSVVSSADQLSGDCVPGLSRLGKLGLNVGEIQISVLRHLATTSAAEKASFEQHIAELREDTLRVLKEYEDAVTVDRDRALVKVLKERLEDYRAARTSVLSLSANGKTEEAMALNKSALRPTFIAYRNAVDELYQFNVNEGNEIGATSHRVGQRAEWMTLTLVGIATALGLVLAWITSRTLNQILQTTANSLTDASGQIVAAAKQVAASSQLLAECSTEEAASLEETSASLEEIASMTKRNSENAVAAKSTAAEAKTVADEGAARMTAMNSAMDAIKGSSDNIAKIIKTIDEIAFQTNLLALNAAVEAARAGEAGAGFAIVADEVRSLAQRSAGAAKEITEQIHDAIQRSARGVEISRDVMLSLQQIVDRARKVDQLVAEISTASTEQTQGISQVLAAVVQMDKVTQQNAATAEESASASEELNAQASSLQELVDDLNRHIKGTNAEARDQAAGTPTSFGRDRILESAKAG